MTRARYRSHAGPVIHPLASPKRKNQQELGFRSAELTFNQDLHEMSLYEHLDEAFFQPRTKIQRICR